MWPSRIIGFSIGTMVYAVMAYTWFNEQITTKTAICLFLSALIILVQVFWKE
jgi:myo-inositol catabolism protein IolC